MHAPPTTHSLLHYGRTTPTKYAYIDALRGIAILGVISLHCAQAVAATNSLLQSAMLSGVRGVQLFYIASAMTLCMSWHTRRKDEAFPVSNYFLRRFWRIAPLFYVAILAYLTVDGFGPRHWAPNGIGRLSLPITILMAHGWHPETINAIVPGGWSIAVEFTFYLLLPLILTLITNTRQSLLFLCLTLVTYAINAFYMTRVWLPAYPANQRYLIESFTFFNIFSQLPVFAVGITTYFAARDNRRWTSISCLLMTIAAVVATSHLMGKSVSVFVTAKNHTVVSAILGWFVLLLSRQGKLHAVFVNAATIFLGRISYGLYLTHFAIIRLLKTADLPVFSQANNAACVCFLATTLFVAVLLSMLLKRFIEDPFIDIGRHIIAARECAGRNSD